ncbi:MAG: 50S ribosomal protein L3 [Deltaproteobacteria bacterium]|jgi:large subunit ribosomal protein L3|nr:50S ribosomal protein L3 [Deltaproteobacteria bacterium]
MSTGLIGKKLGMTRLFHLEGVSVPVTVIAAGPAMVTQVKTVGRDGYKAIQLGYDRARRATKPEAGHLAAATRDGGGELAKPKAFRILREFPVGKDEYSAGQMITLDIFNPGEKISVTGTSKGRGFAGVMKRHGFHGGRATHGCLTPRGGGSIGCSSDPSRVFPGKRMAGHYGSAKTTVKNLEVIDVRPEYGVILVKGAVPGPNGGHLILRKNPTIPL